MSFLASVLPGLREFRSPFSAGVLWLLALGLAVYPHHETIFDSRDAAEVARAIGSIPEVTLLAAAGFAAYVLGIIGTTLTQQLTNVYRWSLYKRPINWLRRRLFFRIGGQSFGSTFESHSVRARVLLSQHVRERMSELSPEIGYSTGARLAIAKMVDDDVELNAFRLSKDSPEQFQQYDKALAEGDFRGAVALPLLTVSIVAYAYLEPTWSYAVIAFGVAAFLLLEALSAASHRRAADLLATSIYLGYTSPPSLDKLESRMKEDMVEHPEDTGDRSLLWLITYFATERLHEYVSPCLAELRRDDQAMADEAVERLKIRERMHEKSKLLEDDFSQ